MPIAFIIIRRRKINVLQQDTILHFYCPEQVYKSRCWLIHWSVVGFCDKQITFKEVKINSWLPTHLPSNCVKTQIVTKLQLWWKLNCNKTQIVTQVNLGQISIGDRKKISTKLQQISNRLHLVETTGLITPSSYWLVSACPGNRY